MGGDDEYPSVQGEGGEHGKTDDIPSREVSRLPETADSIFWPSETSLAGSASASWARAVAVAMVVVVMLIVVVEWKRAGVGVMCEDARAGEWVCGC